MAALFPHIVLCIVPRGSVSLLQYHKGHCLYNEDKLLTCTEVCAIMECPDKCKGGHTSEGKGSGKGKNPLCRVSCCL